MTRILPPDTPLKAIGRTYGKVQGKYPARFLTADEAQRLLDACKDGTVSGKRDSLVIRLGLHGVRSHEILKMTHGNLAGDTLTWTGKRSRIRTVILDSGTVVLIGRWAEHIQRVTGRPIPADTPLVVRLDGGGFQDTRVRVPVEPLRTGVALIDLVQRRASAAELGHLSPHDLRRTTAAILHNTRTADGGHVFDLLDIQRVLGHSDPAVTMRSYLEPLDTGVLRRAADRIGQLRSAPHGNDPGLNPATPTPVAQHLRLSALSFDRARNSAAAFGGNPPHSHCAHTEPGRAPPGFASGGRPLPVASVHTAYGACAIAFCNTCSYAHSSTRPANPMASLANPVRPSRPLGPR